MPNVTLKSSGQTVQAKDGEALIEICKNHGLPIPFGCEDGVCGTCICRVAEGKENLSKAEETEEMTLEAMGLNDGDYVLCCQKKVEGDVVLEQ